MEILTVLEDLYHVNPEDEEVVWHQVQGGYENIMFRDGRKVVILFTRNIVSIECYEEMKQWKTTSKKFKKKLT